MRLKSVVEEVKRRREIFSNPQKYLKVIAEAVKEMDKDAEAYLFGSVAEGRHLLSSDIDVLVVTNRPPGEVLAALWNKGIKDPFEIHVVTNKMFEIYKRRSKLVRVA